MNRRLNREILRLAVPSILANITIPLVGMVDTAVAGHIEGPSATIIGAISVGALFFSLLYWSFAFLRTGTGGLTAQAFGRADMVECRKILLRGCLLALLVAVLILTLQSPFVRLATMVVNASPQVLDLAQRYFYVCIFGAPAALTLMTFRGWFVGMQDSMSSMWTDLIINITNIVCSITLTFGIGSWEGFGFDGIAVGTVISQYCGLMFCIVVCCVKYKRTVFAGVCWSELFSVFHDGHMCAFFKMNVNLFGRSFFFLSFHIGYTMIAASYGDLWLSCSSIMMHLLLLFSYFTDGFAYAGEALTGRFIGENNRAMLVKSVKYVFVWSMSLAAAFVVFYCFAAMPILSLMTSDNEVIDACRHFLPWLLLMPPLGCAAFTWDGIFFGATASESLRNSMACAALAFFAVWIVGEQLFSPTDATAIHLLLGAYFAHLLLRTSYLTFRYRKGVLSRVDTLMPTDNCQ